jgi:hypothetical protein
MSEGTPWSEDELASLAKLARQNLSAAQIADALGQRHGVWRTRCAVIGKLRRHNIDHLGHGKRPPIRAPKAKLAVDRPAVRALPLAMEERSTAALLPLPDLLLPPDPPPPPEDIFAAADFPADEPEPADCRQTWPPHFIDRLHGQCAFPLWGAGERTGQVCGEPVVENSNLQFCREHWRKCVGNGR